MKEYFNKFRLFIVEKRWFFLWLIICFLIDRIATHIVLSSGQFDETNLTALVMWSVFGYVWSEFFTLLFVVIVFFYVGVFGGELVKRIVLPAFCLIYSWMMLGNIVVLTMVIMGNYDWATIFDWLSSINWYVYCFGLSMVSITVVWIFYWIKDRSKL